VNISRAEKKLDSPSTIVATSESDAVMILLQKELRNNLECLFALDMLHNLYYQFSV
jgi:hypothetical protein